MSLGTGGALQGVPKGRGSTSGQLLLLFSRYFKVKARDVGGTAIMLLQAPIIPHMGWNTVQPGDGSRMFAGVEGERFYFVHSYGVREWKLEEHEGIRPPTVTWTEYGGDRFVSAVENGPLWATQFHPEKSGDAGRRLLENWVATL